GATVNANGLLDIVTTGAGLTISGGTLNVNTNAVSGLLAPVVITDGALKFNTSTALTLPTLAMSGGALGGTAAVTITGAFDVTGSSTLAGTGTLTTQGVTTVSMAGDRRSTRLNCSHVEIK